MQAIIINCPSCGGRYDGVITGRFITCEYCGTRYMLSGEELVALGFENADKNEVEDVAAPMEDDGNCDPMSEFARDACREFLKGDGVDADSFESSRKTLAGLGIGIEEVYLIHDDTMFKSGKNGFAITSEGMCCRDLGEKNVSFVSWDEFGKGDQPQIHDSYIRQGETSICYFTDNSDVLNNQLIKLYRKLYRHAQKLA